MTKETPAFPSPMHPEPHGMTLRDYFAAAAMQGDWAAQQIESNFLFTAKTTDSVLTDSATLYYRMADAMLDARNNPQTK